MNFESPHLSIVMMYTTVDTIEAAELLAKKLVESKLVSCINIMAPHESFYMENEALVQIREIGLLIKIPEERYSFAYEAIKSWHPYTIPALLSWPAESNKAYSIWANQQTICYR